LVLVLDYIFSGGGDGCNVEKTRRSYQWDNGITKRTHLSIMFIDAFFQLRFDCVLCESDQNVATVMTSMVSFVSSTPTREMMTLKCYDAVLIIVLTQNKMQTG
jgi:hypothetical protein